jgi:hypothetical protein
MKSKFIARLFLVDCGKASKMTKGVWGAFVESSSPPFTQYSG